MPVAAMTAIEDAIKRGVEMEIARAVEEATKRAKEDLDRRIPAIVAGLSIQILERISMERLRDELLIHVSMPKTRDGAL